jgi:hypothetical protein
MSDPAPDWQLIDDMVVRHAGFPLDLLERLRMPRTSETLDRLAAHEVARATLKDDLLTHRFAPVVEATGDPALRKALSKARSQVGRGCFNPKALAALDGYDLPESLRQPLVRLADETRAAQAAEAAARSAFDGERGSVTEAIRDIYAGDPWLAEAIYISNPDLYERSFHRFVEGRETRRAQERRLALYLHRFCAKNETASFFGPMNYGRFHGEHSDPVRVVKTGRKLSRRKAFYSFWMVEALAETIAADPALADSLPVRLHPLLVLEEGARPRAQFGRQRLALPPRAVAACRAVANCRTLGDLRATVDDPALIDKLLGRLILADLRVPSTVFDPMSALEDAVRALAENAGAAERWLPVIAEFRERLDAIMQAGLEDRVRLTRAVEERFEALTRQPPRRSSGQTYADRTLTYEECTGSLAEFSFNPRFTETLMDRMQPTLALLSAFGHACHEDDLEAARSAFGQLAGKRGQMPYLEFAAGVERLQHDGALDGIGGRRAAFLEGLERLVADRVGTDGVVRLSAADIGTLGRYDTGRAVHTSPDIMLMAPDTAALAAGDYTIVMGEVHQFLASWGSQFLFHDDPAGARARVAERIGGLEGYEGLATVLNARRHKGLINDGFPGTFIELTGFAGEGTDRVAIRDLVVAPDETGQKLDLVHAPDGRKLRLYHAGDDKLHLWAFAVPPVAAPPVRLPDHTPRIMVGDVVFQRARWQVAYDALPLGPDPADEYDMMRALRVAFAQRGIPRRSFVRVPGEKKPMFLDLDNVNACASVLKALAPGQELTVAEMLPDLDGLWLRDQAGRYCVELRGTLVRQARSVARELVA